MEKYWPQNKVYFSGVVAIFPERLESPHDLEELHQYFGTKDLESLKQEVKIYEDKELLKIEPTLDKPVVLGTKFSFTEIDKHTITYDLIKYLIAFKSDKLTTGRITKPEPFINHLLKLLDAAKNLKHRYSSTPIISLTDLWPEAENTDHEMMRFWDLLLAEHFKSNDLDIINIGFEGTFEANGITFPLPFAEVNVNSFTTFGNYLNLPKLSKAIPKSKRKAQFQFDGNSLILELEGFRQIPIKTFRADSPQYEFFNYLIVHPNTNIGRGDITTNIPSCREVIDLTELVRQCGFDKDLKRIFFLELSKAKVNLKQNSILSEDQYDLLISKFEEYRI